MQNSAMEENKTKSWFERNPRKTLFIVILLSIITLAFILEVVAGFLVDKEQKNLVLELLKNNNINHETVIRTGKEVYKISGYTNYDELKISQENASKYAGCYQPYSIWKPCEAKTPLITHDKYGVRGSIEEPNTKNKEEFIIYTFGGSTTYCAESDDNNTWPSHLQKLLNAQDGKYHYKVVNFGVGSYRNNQEMIRLFLEAQNSFKFYGKPSLVIFYDGINDSLYDFSEPHEYIGTHNDLQKISSKLTGDTLYLIKEYFRESILKIYQSLIPGSLKINFKLTFINLYTLFSVGYQTIDQNIISTKSTQIKHYYKTNIELINHLATINNFKVVYFLQSTLYDKNESYWTEYDKRVCDALCKLYKDAYLTTSSKLAELANEYENFIDVRDIFSLPNISVHLDTVHVVPKGNELIAQRLFSELKKRGFVE